MWSLVENLESIRIAGQILFAMDSAHTVQALGAVSVDGAEGATRKKRFSLSSLALAEEQAARPQWRAHHVLVVVVVPPAAADGPRDAKPLAVGALPHHHRHSS